MSKLSDEQSATILKDFLLAHEFDIAIDFEDFGMLAPLFKELIGRDADDLGSNLTVD